MSHDISVRHATIRLQVAEDRIHRFKHEVEMAKAKLRVARDDVIRERAALSVAQVQAAFDSVGMRGWAK